MDRTARPSPRLSVMGRLFQARMWRGYAMAWDGRPTETGVDRAWVEAILRVSREDCLRRARINARLARRLNRLRRESLRWGKSGFPRIDAIAIRGTSAPVMDQSVT